MKIGITHTILSRYFFPPLIKFFLHPSEPNPNKISFILEAPQSPTKYTAPKHHLLTTIINGTEASYLCYLEMATKK